MLHDYCRSTKRYIFAGQNLAELCRFPNYRPLKEAINLAMQMWYDEHRFLGSIKNIKSYSSSNDSSGVIGHFTQMVRDESFAVGCSIVKSQHPADGSNWNCYYIACNYATSNIIRRPVYEIGAIGSKCKTGRNPQYPGLCSKNENYTDNSLLFTKNNIEAPPVTKWKQNGKKIYHLNADTSISRPITATTNRPHKFVTPKIAQMQSKTGYLSSKKGNEFAVVIRRHKIVEIYETSFSTEKVTTETPQIVWIHRNRSIQKRTNIKMTTKIPNKFQTLEVVEHKSTNINNKRPTIQNKTNPKVIHTHEVTQNKTDHPNNQKSTASNLNLFKYPNVFILILILQLVM